MPGSLKLRLVLDDQDPLHAGRLSADRPVAPPFQKKISHGPIIAHAAVTAR